MLALRLVHVASLNAVDAGARVLTATSKLLTSVAEISSNFAALASVQVVLVSAVEAGALVDTSASRWSAFASVHVAGSRPPR